MSYLYFNLVTAEQSECQSKVTNSVDLGQTALKELFNAALHYL